MLSIQKKSLHFDINRCAQCGVCLAACPHEALKTHMDTETGLTSISPTSDCVLCGKCVAVCPARFLPEKRPDAQEPLEVLLGHHSDESVRYAASSGGAVRTLVLEALANNVVEHAYLLLRDSTFPWAKGTLVGRSFTMESAANSIYTPVLAGRNLAEAKGGESILVVGTPCQLYGAFRLLRKRYKKIYSIAIFCKQQKKLDASRHFAKRLGTTFAIQGPPMQYRGEGWPGLVRLEKRAMPWAKMASFPYGQRLWRVPGCRACPDSFCVEADITVADPWGIDQENPGRSMIILWTPSGKELVKNASPTLETSPITTQAMRASVEMQGIIHKAQLAQYYAGKPTSIRVTLAGHTERYQTSVLEWLAETFPIPELGYRILARLPMLAHLLLR